MNASDEAPLRFNPRATGKDKNMFNFKTAALALAIPGLALATPALAAPASHAAPAAQSAYGDLSYDQRDRGRHRGWDKQRGRHDRYDQRRYNSYQSQGGYYGEPVYANTRVWRGEDNRYYCRRSNGTTGLLIGGAAGALLGREVAGRNGDRTLGAILGAAGGALLGREVDRGGSRCR
jgi:hypothetical protein